MIKALEATVGGVVVAAALTLGMVYGVVVGLLTDADAEARAAARVRHPAGKGRQQSMAGN